MCVCVCASLFLFSGRSRAGNCCVASLLYIYLLEHIDYTGSLSLAVDGNITSGFSIIRNNSAGSIQKMQRTAKAFKCLLRFLKERFFSSNVVSLVACALSTDGDV